MKRFMARMAILAIVAPAIWIAALQTADAHHMVLRFNLEEMTQTADRIFVGTCTGVNETTEQIAGGQMAVTVYTFDVEQVVKGRLPKTFSFAQLGRPPYAISAGKKSPVTMHGMPVEAGISIHGEANYKVGQRFLIFLIPNYLGGKVTYPVGLDQGAFRVTTMPSGQEMARNGLDNMGLFTAPYNGTSMSRNDARMVFPESPNPVLIEPGSGIDVQSMTHKRGALKLDSIVKLVSSINLAHGGPAGVIDNSAIGGMQ